MGIFADVQAILSQMARLTNRLILIIMALVELKGTMNTSDFLKINSVFIPDVLSSDYEFNRHSKLELGEKVSACSFEISTDPSVEWKSIVTKLWGASCEGLSLGGMKLWGIAYSPFVKNNNARIKRLGLSKSLFKDLGVSQLKFDFENELIFNNKLAFCGGIELTLFNVGVFFDLISDYENGFVIGIPLNLESDFVDLTRELSNLIFLEEKTGNCKIHLMKAIACALQKGVVVLPYAWKESGDYRLDFFRRNGSS